MAIINILIATLAITATYAHPWNRDKPSITLLAPTSATLFALRARPTALLPATAKPAAAPNTTDLLRDLSLAPTSIKRF